MSFDRPDDTGFITGRVQRGDRLRIRADRSAGTGWLAIVPLPTAIFWIEQSSLDSDDEQVTDAVEHDRVRLAWVEPPASVDPVGASTGQASRSTA